DSRPLNLWEGHPVARGTGEFSIPHRRTEDRSDDCVDNADGRWCERRALSIEIIDAQALHPCLNGGRQNAPKLAIPKHRVGVPVEVPLIERRGRLTMYLGRQPVVGILTERGPAASRVN